jgi:hypothetical protein
MCPCRARLCIFFRDYDLSLPRDHRSRQFSDLLYYCKFCVPDDLNIPNGYFWLTILSLTLRLSLTLFLSTLHDRSLVRALSLPLSLSLSLNVHACALSLSLTLRLSLSLSNSYSAALSLTLSVPEKKTCAHVPLSGPILPDSVPLSGPILSLFLRSIIHVPSSASMMHRKNMVCSVRRTGLTRVISLGLMWTGRDWVGPHKGCLENVFEVLSACEGMCVSVLLVALSTLCCPVHLLI